MAWIETIPPGEADAGLAKLFRAATGKGGAVDHVLQVHGLVPETLRAHLALYRAAMHPASGQLSSGDRELVGLCVSMENRCDYCIAHHFRNLAEIAGRGAAEDLRDSLEGRGEADVLTSRDTAMVAYARKLTRSPGNMTESDLAPLRGAGLDDRAIVELNQVVSYFAYVNRTVLGLGVTLEPTM